MNHVRWHLDRCLTGPLRVIAVVLALGMATPAGAQHHSHHRHPTPSAPQHLSALPTLVVAHTPEATPAAEPSTPAAPKTVRVGVYFNHVHSLSLHDNSYHIDLYLWFVWNPREWVSPRRTRPQQRTPSRRPKRRHFPSIRSSSLAQAR